MGANTVKEKQTEVGGYGIDQNRWHTSNHIQNPAYCFWVDILQILVSP